MKCTGFLAVASVVPLLISEAASKVYVWDNMARRFRQRDPPVRNVALLQEWNRSPSASNSASHTVDGKKGASESCDWGPQCFFNIKCKCKSPGPPKTCSSDENCFVGFSHCPSGDLSRCEKSKCTCPKPEGPPPYCTAPSDCYKKRCGIGWQYTCKYSRCRCVKRCSVWRKCLCRYGEVPMCLAGNCRCFDPRSG